MTTTLKTIDEILKIETLRFNSREEPYPLPYEDSGVCIEAAEDVANVVRSGKVSYWRGGPKAKELEKKFSDLIGKKNGFFHSSGSSALITAVRAFELPKGTNVAITSSGFISSLNAVYHANLRPRFIPTNPETLLGDFYLNEQVTYEAPLSIVTHFFGNVADVDDITEKASSKYLIEDASQALGSKLNDKYVGKYGDISTFAGSNRKLFGAGQGGMNVYDDESLGERMRIIGHHGKSDNVNTQTPGFNFRGCEMEAVLGLHSLTRMNEKAILRNKSAQIFKNTLSDTEIKIAKVNERINCEVVWFDNVIVLPKNWTKNDRNILVDILNAQGVPAWIYPSLIETSWLKSWMISRGWWTEEEERLLKSEKEIWDRVFVVGTQMSPEDSKKCAQIIKEILVR